MTAVKLSIVIPYKNRLHNISLVFESLARQTMPKDDFEVVVGAMEYSTAFTETCDRFSERLNIITVASAKKWQVALARNMAIRQAVGSIVVFLDADIVVSPTFLEQLYDRHYAHGQQQCVIGQMIDYDNNQTDVGEVILKPYGVYADQLEILERSLERRDQRFKVIHNIPWAFAWTALIALPRAALTKHSLNFDENFFGYGVEDLEWGYRICRAGLPIVLKEDVFGLHLPHPRNIDQNRETEARNYRYFLTKFPDLEVELTCAFGDFLGNAHCGKLKAEIAAATGSKGMLSWLANGMSQGRSVMVIGLIGEDSSTLLSDPALKAFDKVEAILPILGLAIPYADQAVDRCIILPFIDQLSSTYRDLVLKECKRVAHGIG